MFAEELSRSVGEKPLRVVAEQRDLESARAALMQVPDKATS